MCGSISALHSLLLCSHPLYTIYHSISTTSCASRLWFTDEHTLVTRSQLKGEGSRCSDMTAEVTGTCAEWSGCDGLLSTLSRQLISPIHNVLYSLLWFTQSIEMKATKMAAAQRSVRRHL